MSVLFPIFFALAAGPVARPADPDAPARPAARGAVEPATPELPAAIVAAMQEGRYDDADKALAALADASKTSGELKAYLAVIRGAALRLSGKLDAARDVLSAALKAAPGGRWAAKVRSELVAVEVAAGRFVAAEALARQEAESLLAGDRKDRLAGVYRGFADRLLTPDLPTIPADPEGAYALLAQARSLAKGETLRASLLLAMARASQKAGNHARAIADFQAYLGEYPRGADRDAVRYGLGESQLATGQPLPARLTWTDLARDLEKVDNQGAADTRARSLYGIAKTHGIPTPPDDAQMNLGVAALRRMLASYPSHPLAVRAAYESPRRTSRGTRARRRSRRSNSSPSRGRPAATTRRAASGPSC
jgi:tetratricopeptide (TPR) repeat protein